MGFLAGAGGGAASGAAAGSAFGPYGALIGAVGGGVLGGLTSSSDGGLTDGQRADIKKNFNGSDRILTGLQRTTVGGVNVLTDTASQDANVLRSYQQRQLDDTTRAANTRLNAAGFRNAGRGGILAAQEGIDRQRESLVRDNRQEQLAAAGQLASANFGARNAKVGIRTGYQQAATAADAASRADANAQTQSQFADIYKGLGYTAGQLAGQTQPTSGGSAGDRFKYLGYGGGPKASQGGVTS